MLKPDQYSDEPLNTLDNALLELDASRNWVLADVRNDRGKGGLSGGGFLSGENLGLFMRKLYKDTDPILDPVHRQQFLQLLK